MADIDITKQGIVHYKYNNTPVISNPPISNSVAGWTHLVIRNGLITNRIGDGGISSPSFNIASNEILQINVSIKTSNYVSGSGIFLGITQGSVSKILVWNESTRTYTERDPSGNWDRYFINDYKNTNIFSFTSYITGADVPLSFVAPPSTSFSYAINALRLKSSISSIILNTGNNAADSANEWTFYNIDVNRFTRVNNGGGINEMNKLGINEIYED